MLQAIAILTVLLAAIVLERLNSRSCPLPHHAELRHRRAAIRAENLARAARDARETQRRERQNAVTLIVGR